MKVRNQILVGVEDTDFKLKEIQSQSMNWETGVMTVKDHIKGTVEKHQALPPKSPMYYALKIKRENVDENK